MRERQKICRGFTLVELLIVVSIVGILAVIGYPAYQDHVEKTRYADAKVKLMEIMQLQRRHFTDNSTYTENLVADFDYEDADGTGTVSTDKGFYLITADLCEDGDDDLPIEECVNLIASANFGGGDQTQLTYNSKNERTGPPAAW